MKVPFLKHSLLQTLPVVTAGPMQELKEMGEYLAEPGGAAETQPCTASMASAGSGAPFKGTYKGLPGNIPFAFVNLKHNLRKS